MAVPPDLRGGALPCLLHVGHVSRVPCSGGARPIDAARFLFLAASVSFLGAGAPPRGALFKEAVGVWEGVGEGEVAARRRAVDAAAGAGQHRDRQTRARTRARTRAHCSRICTLPPGAPALRHRGVRDGLALAPCGEGGDGDLASPHPRRGRPQAKEEVRRGGWCHTIHETSRSLLGAFRQVRRVRGGVRPREDEEAAAAGGGGGGGGGGRGGAVARLAAQGRGQGARARARARGAVMLVRLARFGGLQRRHGRAGLHSPPSPPPTDTGDGS